MLKNPRIVEQLMICCGVALVFYTARTLFIIRDAPKLRQAGQLMKLMEMEMDLAEKPRMLVVTRIHMKEATSMPDVSKVVKFVQSSQSYSDGILICIGADDFSSILQYMATIKETLTNHNVDQTQVHLLPVYPWGHFVTSLNSAVGYAQDLKFQLIAFQSLEVSITQYEVRCVVQRLRVRNTLVVGPVLEGHEFITEPTQGSTQPLTGRTCPWNTFAIWRVRELGFVGFPLIGDGTADDRACGGVEELTAITMLQKIRPEYSAVLLQIQPHKDSASTLSTSGGAVWDTQFTDPERQKYHTRKMESKNSRPAAQLIAMGIEAGTVLHEVCEGL